MSTWDPRRPSDEHDDSPYDDTASSPSSPTPETPDMSRTPTPDLPARPELDDEDLEQLLRGAFDARTRAEVPDDRMPPPIEWPSTRPARRPWLTPLAVAASIAVVAAGGGLALAHQQRDTPLPPATQSVTAAPTSGSPTSAPTGTPSTTATGTATATGSATGTVAPPATSTAPSSTTTTASAQRVTAGGATLTVPAGYTFRQETGLPGGGTPGSPTWCFDTQGTSDCAFSFVAYAAGTGLDADTEGGTQSNPEYCGVGGASNGPGLVTYEEPTWGGRAAEQRVWHLACASGKSYDIAQYTVMTPQAYGLVSESATPAVQSAMAQVVAGSTLPAATSSTRLYDHGYLRSATAGPGGTTVIAIDRVVRGRPNGNPTTYSYVVPTSVYPTDKLQAAVGTLLSVETNGSVATQVLLMGG